MKKLLITTNENGLTIKADTGARFTKKLYAGHSLFEREWDPVEWYYYTLVNMKFSVKKGEKIQLRLDQNSMLKHYRFATFKRPKEYKHPHWSKKAISIDNARDIKANYTGIKASDCFKDLRSQFKTLQFEYNGPDAQKDANGKVTNLHYFAYDLHLKIPNTEHRLWIGPVIRNNGGLGGEP